MRRDFPTFPRFMAWSTQSPAILDRFLMSLRDYLLRQAPETIEEVEWVGPAEPTKALTSVVKPIGVIPICYEIKDDAGYVSSAVAVPVQWSWSVVEGRGTLTFPTLAGLSGSYRMRFIVKGGD